MTTQPQEGDTVNIQLYAVTFNDDEMYDYLSHKKINKLTCTNSNEQYSTWNCDFIITFEKNNKSFNVNCQILFNRKNNTFQIINNIKDTNTENSKYESVNLSYIKSKIPLGSFWSGNGQTKPILNINDGSTVLAHTWHTLFIQASKFDSYFGVPSSS